MKHNKAVVAAVVIAIGSTTISLSSPVTIPIATGELFDKITILQIKLERIYDPEKHKNISNEHCKLLDVLDQTLTNSVKEELSPVAQELLKTNKLLWDMEDSIRAKELKKEFDQEFIELSRKIYYTNDERCRLKRVINETTRSDIIEEKQYTGYQ